MFSLTDKFGSSSAEADNFRQLFIAAVRGTKVIVCSLISIPIQNGWSATIG